MYILTWTYKPLSGHKWHLKWHPVKFILKVRDRSDKSAESLTQKWPKTLDYFSVTFKTKAPNATQDVDSFLHSQWRQSPNITTPAPFDAGDLMSVKRQTVFTGCIPPPHSSPRPLLLFSLLGPIGGSVAVCGPCVYVSVVNMLGCGSH